MALDRFENSLLMILTYFFLKINNLSLHLSNFLFEEFHVIKEILFMRQGLILGTEEFFLEGSGQTTINNNKNDCNTQKNINGVSCEGGDSNVDELVEEEAEKGSYGGVGIRYYRL
jgi:hypothetical protein